MHQNYKLSVYEYMYVAGNLSVDQLTLSLSVKQRLTTNSIVDKHNYINHIKPNCLQVKM
jgi:hypothetical protein